MTDAHLDDLLAGPDAVRVRKRPVPVEVVFATNNGLCETLEGPVRYRAGDAILTGKRGEQWPVARASFDASYAAIAPTRHGQNGAYRKQAGGARAVRLGHAIDVPVGWKSDPLHGKAGDWLLRYDNGDFGLVQDDVFRESYDPER